MTEASDASEIPAAEVTPEVIPHQESGIVNTPFYRGMWRRAVEGGIGGITLGFDVVRWLQMHPKRLLFSDGWTEAPINPSNTDPNLYSFLEHVGDVPEGFFLTFGAYTALRTIDGVQSVLTRRHIPDPVIFGLSATFGAGFVAAFESGSISPGKQPDLWDIPAGVAGAALYVAANLGVRKIMPEPTRTPISQGNSA
jgi:hypothetical protein